MLNICDFLLIRALVLQGRILLLEEINVFPFRVGPYTEGDTINFDRVYITVLSGLPQKILP